MTLAAGSKLGPYEILAPLSAGGMGDVYKARDTRLERTVAIKVLPSHLAPSTEVRQRFEREAKTISQLSHPRICALDDVGNQDGVEYLVMEYLEGETRTAGERGAEKILARTKQDKVLPTVSPDGRSLLYSASEGPNFTRVLAPLSAGDSLQLSGDSRFSEEHPEISPDSRWTAFDSSESGQREVYTQPLPGGPKRQVSIGGARCRSGIETARSSSTLPETAC